MPNLILVPPVSSAAMTASSSAGGSSSSWVFLSHLKRLDAYPKTLEDFRVQTLFGGCITLGSAIIMILLFTAEIRDYLQKEVQEELFVDTSR